MIQAAEVEQMSLEERLQATVGSRKQKTEWGMRNEDCGKRGFT
jgi:hypothetical protein